jgi:quinol monooxygenase YgiN
MTCKLTLLASAAVLVTAVSANHAQARSPQPVTVITYIDAIPDVFVKENEEKARALLQQMNAETQKDPGLISFTILRETQRPNHFTILEMWKSAAAFSAHLSAPHTRKFRDDLQPLIGSPYDTLVTRVSE